MYLGNQSFYKKDICIYILAELLIHKKLDVESILNFTGISRHTLVRYVSSIKNALFDFGYYNIEIYFDRTYSCYRCIID